MLGTASASRVYLGAEHLTPGLGGIARVARLSLRALEDAGYRITARALLDQSALAVGRTRAATSKGGRGSFVAAAQVGKLAHGAFLYDTVGTARAHGTGAFGWRPYACWVHGTEVWYNLHRGREKALRGAELVIANSQFCLDRFAQRHWELPNAVVCNLATEDDHAPASMAHFSGRPRVLILGTMDQSDLYKGHAELIAAWPSVLAQVPEAELVIAGGGAGQAGVAALAQASPAAGSIRMTGFVAECDLPALWANTTVFAMPSRNEGFGLVYIEAMRHGLPILASRQDAGQEINRHGVTGYNVDQSDIATLAARLIQLLQSPEQCRRMGRTGHALWQGQYRYSAFRDRFLGLI